MRPSNMNIVVATRLWEMRQRQITQLEGFSLSVEQIEVMCQKYRDLGQVSIGRVFAVYGTYMCGDISSSYSVCSDLH